jgi:hypothetical protein
LEHHPNLPPQSDDIYVRVMDIDPMNPHPPVADAGDIDEVIHPVEAAQERDLPHPDGPMNAVTFLAGIWIVMSCSAWAWP